jgi:HEAT repeat protein
MTPTGACLVGVFSFSRSPLFLPSKPPTFLCNDLNMDSAHEQRRLSEQGMAHLVHGLDNLRWNLSVQADLLALGDRVVPALVAYLLEPTGQFPEGRVLAAEILGRIGGEAALQGLTRALDPRRFEGLGPVLRLSEETAQDAVARQLGRIGQRRVIPALLHALQAHRLLGAAEALGRLRERDALPWLIQGLEDAFKRDRFAQILLEFGTLAVQPLVETLGHRRMRDGQELLPSLERRAAALRLLGLLGAGEAAAAARSALTESADTVRLEAALALVSLAEGDEALAAAPPLLAGLTHPHFLRRDECAEALIRLGPACAPLVHAALAEGTVMAGGEAIPLTANARHAALNVLERLNGARC